MIYFEKCENYAYFFDKYYRYQTIVNWIKRANLKVLSEQKQQKKTVPVYQKKNAKRECELLLVVKNGHYCIRFNHRCETLIPIFIKVRIYFDAMLVQSLEKYEIYV